jgi:hypothetical protein
MTKHSAFLYCEPASLFISGPDMLTPRQSQADQPGNDFYVIDRYKLYFFSDSIKY